MPADLAKAVRAKEFPASRKLFVCLALALIWAAVLRSAIATRLDSFTLDEPYHIAAGVSYVRYHDFRVNPEHPPLVKLWVGTVIAATGFKLGEIRQFNDKPEEREFTTKATIRMNDPDSVQRRARAAMYLFNGLLLLALALALERTFSARVALGSLLFLAIDPTVAAHLPVVMTDLPVALLAAISVVLAAKAFRDWRWSDLAACSGFLGLALATKHSAPVVLLSIAALGIMLAIVQRSSASDSSRSRWAKFAKVVAVVCGAMVILWASYFFRYSETSSGREVFNRPLQKKIDDVISPRYRALLKAMDATRVVPRPYLWGFADTVHAGMEGRDTIQIILGRRYPFKGPRYFFPLIMAVKIPIGLTVLTLLGLGLLLSRRVQEEYRFPGWCVLAVLLVFLLVLASGATYAGIRHALPAVALLSIFAGAGMATAMEPNRGWLRAVTAVALLAAMASALPQMRPWGYFNELAGGQTNAYKYFLDEGTDLGLRTKELAAYALREVPKGERPLCWYYDSGSEFKARGVDCFGSDEKRDGPLEELPQRSGTILIDAGQLAPSPYWDRAALRASTPMARFGAAFVFRGTFYLPGHAASAMYWRGIDKLYGEKPDEAAAEKAFQKSAELDPKAYFVHIQLANLYLKRGAREECVRAYAEALQYAPENQTLRTALSTQIERIAQQGLAAVQPLRDPSME